jgi:hypothetical protein
MLYAFVVGVGIVFGTGFTEFLDPGRPPEPRAYPEPETTPETKIAPATKTTPDYDLHTTTPKCRPQTALKYFASGWWNTMAAVDSSGTSAPALVSSISSFSRAGSSRKTVSCCMWSGQAG